jgi:DNA-directed RNA polymerase subunit RPC12/RpoP
MSAFTLHDLASSSQPVGVECRHCIRRALLSRDDLRAVQGDRRTLAEGGLRCSQCGSRDFSTERIQSRSAAHSFMRNI